MRADDGGFQIGKDADEFVVRGNQISDNGGEIPDGENGDQNEQALGERGEQKERQDLLQGKKTRFLLALIQYILFFIHA